MNASKTERKVAWTMLDGNIMAGTVVSEFRGRLEVRRVDGGMVSIQEEFVHDASPDEILAACDFYRTLGR